MQAVKHLSSEALARPRGAPPRRPGSARWLLLVLSTSALLATGAWSLTEQFKAEPASVHSR
jgi:hypothetical protein